MVAFGNYPAHRKEGNALLHGNEHYLCAVDLSHGKYVSEAGNKTGDSLSDLKTKKNLYDLCAVCVSV